MRTTRVSKNDALGYTCVNIFRLSLVVGMGATPKVVSHVMFSMPYLLRDY